MEETLKMMKSILWGKEKGLSEQELIKKYQDELCPEILAKFFVDNYLMNFRIGLLFPKLSDEDKASFCLQELDKALLNFDLSKNTKFSTYFYKCFKNCLRSETQKLFMQKRKLQILVDYLETDKLYELSDKVYFDEINSNDMDLFLSDYRLNNDEKECCKLLANGYSVKEIAKRFKVATITIYKKIERIREKILQNNINFA